MQRNGNGDNEGCDIPGVRIEQGRYHSLEATDEMGVVFEAKAHRYEIGKTEEYLCNNTNG